VKKGKAIAWKYIGLRHGAVLRFQKLNGWQKMASKAETCSKCCDFNVILN
jgi:hypothetical protein